MCVVDNKNKMDQGYQFHNLIPSSPNCYTTSTDIRYESLIMH